MTQVSGFDSSATAAVSKLRRFIADRNIEGIIISTQHRVTSACRSQGWSFKHDIDDALIYGEDMLIDTAMIKEGRQTMSYWLSEICCGNKDISNYLFKVLELVENNENQLICKAGEESNTLFFIEKGPVAVYTNGESGEKLRVRVFQDLTLAGEMGFILNTPRSADLEAQDGSIVWSLDRENYYQLISSNPEAERHLLSYIIKLLSERLVFSNREISILRAGAPDHP
jgi:SulP family sulfate permease